jgi:hypothetical protein
MLNLIVFIALDYIIMEFKKALLSIISDYLSSISPKKSRLYNRLYGGPKSIIFPVPLQTSKPSCTCAAEIYNLIQADPRKFIYHFKTLFWESTRNGRIFIPSEMINFSYVIAKNIFKTIINNLEKLISNAWNDEMRIFLHIWLFCCWNIQYTSKHAITRKIKKSQKYNLNS